MKKITFLFFMLLSFVGFTQTQTKQSDKAKQTDQIKITLDTISKASRVADIIDVDIRACRVLSYHFSTGNNAKSLDVTGEMLTDEVKVIIKELKTGDRFTIDNIKYECTPEYKRNFMFIIVKQK